MASNTANHLSLEYKTENELKFAQWAMREYGMTNKERTTHTFKGQMSVLLEVWNVVDIITLPISLVSAGGKFIGKEVAKEVGEELGEKAVKEVAEEAVEKTVKTEVSEEIAESAAKKEMADAAENLSWQFANKGDVLEGSKDIERVRGATAGDMTLKSEPYDYFNNIKNRTDIDPDGYFDIVVHGDINKVQIEVNGKVIMADHRFIGNMLLHSESYTGQPIRLLSCNTGFSDTGFAQNLSNYLNVKVQAPTKYIWAYPNGKHVVAGGKISNGRLIMVSSDKGIMKNFYPRGGKP